jgi:glycosyltransferase involved in cell wall biosynthesis
MKLCVFPNDPIRAYFEKGEIKENYYNPQNFFNEVHIISFTQKDIDELKVQKLVGKAKLKIHSVDKINLKDRGKFLEKILSLIKEINPDIIRAYNPLLEGWFAAQCSKKLGIPFFLSLHTQYDQNRKLVKKKNLKKFLALKYTEKLIEPFVLKQANKITIVYKIIESYVLKHLNEKPEILYNKVNCEKFSNSSIIKSLPSPLIISVGRLIKEKNHQCLIKSMQNIDAHCLIIGDGDRYKELQDLIKKLNLEKKVLMKKSIPNDVIQDYYKSAQVFALAYDPELEGIPIPVIEAMAAGLPIVIPFPKHNYSDNLENTAIFSHTNPDSFSENIKKILDNSEKAKELAKKSLIKSKEFDSTIIEKREAEIYEEIISKNIS